MQSPNMVDDRLWWPGRLLLPLGVLAVAVAVLVDYLLPPDVVVVTVMSAAGWSRSDTPRPADH